MVDAPGDLLSAHQEKRCPSATTSVSAYKEYELSVVTRLGLSRRNDTPRRGGSPSGPPV
jgi:hypothetical protein